MQEFNVVQVDGIENRQPSDAYGQMFKIIKYHQLDVHINIILTKANKERFAIYVHNDPDPITGEDFCIGKVSIRCKNYESAMYVKNTLENWSNVGTYPNQEKSLNCTIGGYVYGVKRKQFVPASILQNTKDNVQNVERVTIEQNDVALPPNSNDIVQFPSLTGKYTRRVMFDVKKILLESYEQTRFQYERMLDEEEKLNPEDREVLSTILSTYIHPDILERISDRIRLVQRMSTAVN